MSNLNVEFGKRTRVFNKTVVVWDTPDGSDSSEFFLRTLKDIPSSFVHPSIIMDGEFWDTLCKLNPEAKNKEGRGLYSLGLLLEHIEKQANKYPKNKDWAWMLYWAKKARDEYGAYAYMSIS